MLLDCICWLLFLQLLRSCHCAVLSTLMYCPANESHTLCPYLAESEHCVPFGWSQQFSSLFHCQLSSQLRCNLSAYVCVSIVSMATHLQHHSVMSSLLVNWTRWTALIQTPNGPTYAYHSKDDCERCLSTLTRKRIRVKTLYRLLLARYPPFPLLNDVALWVSIESVCAHCHFAKWLLPLPNQL